LNFNFVHYKLFEFFVDNFYYNLIHL